MDNDSKQEKNMYDKINKNLPLTTVLFFAFCTLLSIFYLVSYLGYSRIGLLLFYDNADVLKIVLNLAPCFLIIVILSVVFGAFTTRNASVDLVSGKVNISKLDNNVYPAIFIITPPISYFVICRLAKADINYNVISGIVSLLAVSVLMVVLAFAMSHKMNRKVALDERIFATLLISLFLSGALGFFFRSYNESIFTPCYDVSLKNDIAEHQKTIAKARLILSLGKGMAFDLAGRQLFLSSDNIAALKQVPCTP